jgi:hypothetical protein
MANALEGLNDPDEDNILLELMDDIPTLKAFMKLQEHEGEGKGVGAARLK